MQNSLRFPLSLTISEISANLPFFKFWENLWKFRKFRKFWLFLNFQNCCVVIIDNAVIQNFHPFLTVSEISPFYLKIKKLAVFSKFWTHDLKVLSLYYEKALLLHIGNIAAKLEDATPCSYRDMLRTKQWDARPPPARRHRQ